MKKQLSIKLDETLYSHIKEKPNLSRYIEELVKQDIQMQYQKPITQAVIAELLENEMFISELSSRLGSTPHQPSPPQSPTPQINEPEKNHNSADQLIAAMANLPAMERACCTAKSPCKHWSFDGVEDVWVNSFSGRERGE